MKKIAKNSEKQEVYELRYKNINIFGLPVTIPGRI
jgi:hypothetical protein